MGLSARRADKNMKKCPQKGLRPHLQRRLDEPAGRPRGAAVQLHGDRRSGVLEVDGARRCGDTGGGGDCGGEGGGVAQRYRVGRRAQCCRGHGSVDGQRVGACGCEVVGVA